MTARILCTSETRKWTRELVRRCAWVWYISPVRFSFPTVEDHHPAKIGRPSTACVWRLPGADWDLNSTDLGRFKWWVNRLLIRCVLGVVVGTLVHIYACVYIYIYMYMYVYMYVNRKRVFLDDADHRAHGVCSKINRRVYMRVCYLTVSRRTYLARLTRVNNRRHIGPRFVHELGGRNTKFLSSGVRSMPRERFRIRPRLVLWPLNEQAPCASNIEHFPFPNLFSLIIYLDNIDFVQM